LLNIKNGLNSVDDVRKEAIKLLPENVALEYKFEYTDEDSEETRIFNHGCDIILKRFDDKFESAFLKKEKEFAHVQN